MASSSSGIIKAFLVIIFVGIVFYGLNWLLEPVPQDEDSAVAAVADTQTGDNTAQADSSTGGMTPEQAEAASYGADIGRRVGAEIGRQVGLAAVAGLQAAGVEPGTAKPAAEKEVVAAEAAPQAQPAPAPVAKPEPKPTVVAAPKPEPKPEPKPVVTAAPKPAPKPEPAPPVQPEPEVSQAVAEAAATDIPESEPQMDEQESMDVPALAADDSGEDEIDDSEPVIKKNRRLWLPNKISPRP